MTVSFSFNTILLPSLPSRYTLVSLYFPCVCCGLTPLALPAWVLPVVLCCVVFIFYDFLCVTSTAVTLVKQFFIYWACTVFPSFVHAYLPMHMFFYHNYLYYASEIGWRARTVPHLYTHNIPRILKKIRNWTRGKVNICKWSLYIEEHVGMRAQLRIIAVGEIPALNGLNTF